MMKQGTPSPLPDGPAALANFWSLAAWSKELLLPLLRSSKFQYFLQFHVTVLSPYETNNMTDFDSQVHPKSSRNRSDFVVEAIFK